MLSQPLRVGFGAASGAPQQVAPTFLFSRQSAPSEPPAVDVSPDAADEEVWSSVWSPLRAEVVKRLPQSFTVFDGWRMLTDEMITSFTKWTAPPTASVNLLEGYEKIGALFRRMTGLDNASLHPVSEEKNLNVRWRGRYLPINAFGDGVRHLLMMAYEFARRRDHVFLIEEPETHLHPGLQRHLLQLMKEDDRNQFIVTTHSPVLLDAGHADVVYRIEYDGDRSTVKKCDTTKDFYRVLDALGARASDILQANVVVWVEGPTDRMVLNRCLELIEAKLVEGIAYQIAYYGGSLRSHVTFDETAPDLVNLLSLCRHAVIVLDSDKTAEGQEINEHKKRLVEECEKNGGFAWVTKGREIENYIPDDVLTKTYRRLLPDAKVEVRLGQFDKLDDVLKGQVKEPKHGDKGKVDYGSNKTRLMPEFLKDLEASELNRWDLKEQLSALVANITQANESSATATSRP